MAETLPGILAIWNDCAPGREAEFEEWYQHEHLLERIAVPGFLLGRRYEVVSGSPRYFCFYLTESPAVLTSEAYLDRLSNPTPMTRRIMSDTFHKTNRTICRRTRRLGAMRGSVAVTLRFTERVDQAAIEAVAAERIRDKAVAGAELWLAADADAPVSEEERLRGGDARIQACLLLEMLRIADAEQAAAMLKSKFSKAEVGVYRLLCEIRSAVTLPPSPP